MSFSNAQVPVAVAELVAVVVEVVDETCCLTPEIPLIIKLYYFFKTLFHILWNILLPGDVTRTEPTKIRKTI